MLPTRRLSTKRGAGVQKLGEGYANKVKKNKKYVLDKKKLQLGHFSEGVWSGGHLLLSGISVTQKIALGGWSTPTRQFSYLHYSTYISSTSPKILH